MTAGSPQPRQPQLDLHSIAEVQRETHAGSPSYRWRRVELIVLLGALSTFGPLSLDMYLPGLPDLRRDFSTSASQAERTLSACLPGLATGQLIAGPMSDRHGRRRPLLIGLAGYAVASILCALAPSIYALIVCRSDPGCAFCRSKIDRWPRRDHRYEFRPARRS